jgi:hypothetical protein
VDWSSIIHIAVACGLAVCGLAFFLAAARVALLLAIVGAGVCWFIGSHNPTPLVFWAYPYFLVPAAITLVPLLWRRREALVLAAAAQVAYMVTMQSVISVF